MKKKNIKVPKPDVLMDRLNEPEQEKYREFLENINLHLQLPKKQKALLLNDFNSALDYFLKNDIPFEEAIRRLSPEQLGGFYAHPASSWYPLDNAAIIYPLSMKFGQMPMFRMSAYLKEEVVPEILQMALDFTIKRFPSFATILKSGVFWHYLDSTKKRFSIEEEKILPLLPISSGRAQSFRVVYYKNRISIEYFHVLTDGFGGSVFLNTLVGEYLRLLGHDIPCSENLWDINDTPHEDELSNEFAKAELQKGASGFMGRTATQMSGKISPVFPCRVVHFEMDSNQLHSVAKSHNATISAYLLAQMFLAQKYATEDLNGEIRIQVPVNMRKYNGSRTIRNYAMYFSCDLPTREIKGSVDDLIPNISKQVKEKSSEKDMNKMMSTTIKLVQSLKFVPLLIKKPVATMVYGFLGDKIFSNYLSNLGVMKVPDEMNEYVEKYDFILGPSNVCRASCGLITFNNRSVFSITKTTVDPSYEEKLYELLTADGIDIDVTGSAVYGD